MSLYSDLGVPDDATKDDIRSAYRHKAGRLHPDKPDGDEEEFKKVQHAYMILSDQQKKEAYDKDGSAENKPTKKEQAIDMITELFLNLAEGNDFGKKDYFPEIRESIKTAKVQTAMQLVKAEGLHDSLEYLVSHIKCDEWMMGKMKGRLDVIAAGRDSCDEYIIILSLALDVLDDYNYFGYVPHAESKIHPYVPYVPFGGMLNTGVA